jgi:hypothetical protein
MILKPCFAETLFISAIGFAKLLATSFFPAGVAAITVPSVAVATDPEQLAVGGQIRGRKKMPQLAAAISSRAPRGRDWTTATDHGRVDPLRFGSPR